jgi:hypothetical protein
MTDPQGGQPLRPLHDLARRHGGWDDTKDDPVNHPRHYRSASGVECIEITEHMNFCLGNAMKYLWRSGEKGDVVTDLRKAIWYIQREIARLEKSK